MISRQNRLSRRTILINFFNQEFSYQLNGSDDMALPDVIFFFFFLDATMKLCLLILPLILKKILQVSSFEHLKDGLASVDTNDSPIMEARQIIISADAEPCGVTVDFRKQCLAECSALLISARFWMTLN